MESSVTILKAKNGYIISSRRKTLVPSSTATALNAGFGDCENIVCSSLDELLSQIEDIFKS